METGLNIPESCRLLSERIKIISLFFRNKLRNSLSFPHLSESVLDLAIYLNRFLKSQEPTLHRGYGMPTFAASGGPKYFFHSCKNEIADQFVIIGLLWCVYLTLEKDMINGKLTHWPIEMCNHPIRYDN